MRKPAIQLGIWGAALGLLAGLVELGIGSQIRPWIGNKEALAILGLVTMLLSGLALAAVTVARKREAQTNDGKLAIFLGVLLPAAICFSSRLFTGMGGGIVFIGLILCLVWLPGIMAQVQYGGDYLG